MFHNQHLENLKKEILKGNVTLFLGSYLPTLKGYPSWKDVISEIEKELGYITEEEYINQLSTSNTLEEKKQLFDLYNNQEKDPIKLMQLYENKFSKNQLHRLFIDLLSNPNSEKRQPNENLLDILLEIPFKRIITTNVDKEIEKILDNKENQYHRIIKDSDLSVFDENKTALYKIHGSIDLHESLVFTEDEYLNHHKDNPRLFDEIKSLATKTTFLFIGYSFKDPDLRMLFNDIKRDVGKFQRESYIVTLTLKEEEKKDFERFNIKVLEVDKEFSIDNLISDLTNSYKDLIQKQDKDQNSIARFVNVESEIEVKNLKKQLEINFQKNLVNIEKMLEDYDFQRIKEEIYPLEDTVKEITNKELLIKFYALKFNNEINLENIEEASNLLEKLKTIGLEEKKLTTFKAKYLILTGNSQEGLKLLEQKEEWSLSDKLLLGYLYLSNHEIDHLENLIYSFDYHDYENKELKNILALYYALKADIKNTFKYFQPFLNSLDDSNTKKAMDYLHAGDIYITLLQALNITSIFQEGNLSLYLMTNITYFDFLIDINQLLKDKALKYYTKALENADDTSYIKHLIFQTLSKNKLLDKNLTEKYFTETKTDQRYSFIHELTNKISELNNITEINKLLDEYIENNTKYTKFIIFYGLNFILKIISINEIEEIVEKYISKSKWNEKEHNLFEILKLRNYLKVFIYNKDSFAKQKLEETIKKIKPLDIQSQFYLLKCFSILHNDKKYEEFLDLLEKNASSNYLYKLERASFQVKNQQFDAFYNTFETIISLTELLVEQNKTVLLNFYKYFIDALSFRNQNQIILKLIETSPDYINNNEIILFEKALSLISFKDYNSSIEILKKLEYSTSIKQLLIEVKLNLAFIFFNLGDLNKYETKLSETFYLAEELFKKDHLQDIDNSVQIEKFLYILNHYLDALLLNHKTESAFKLSQLYKDNYPQSRKLFEIYIYTQFKTGKIDWNSINVFNNMYPDQEIVKLVPFDNLLNTIKNRSKDDIHLSKICHNLRFIVLHGLMPIDTILCIGNYSSKFYKLMYFNDYTAFCGTSDIIKIEIANIKEAIKQNKKIIINVSALINLIKYNLIDDFFNHLRNNNSKICIYDNNLDYINESISDLSLDIAYLNKDFYSQIKKDLNYSKNNDHLKIEKRINNTLHSLERYNRYAREDLHLLDQLVTKNPNKNIFYLDEYVWSKINNNFQEEYNQFKQNNINLIKTVDCLDALSSIKKTEKDNYLNYEHNHNLEHGLPSQNSIKLDLKDIIVINNETIQHLASHNILQPLLIDFNNVYITEETYNYHNNYLNKIEKKEEFQKSLFSLKEKISSNQDIINEINSTDYSFSNEFKELSKQFSLDLNVNSFCLDYCLKESATLYIDDLGLITLLELNNAFDKIKNKYFSTLGLINYLYNQDNIKLFEKYKMIIHNQENGRILDFNVNYIKYLLNIYPTQENFSEEIKNTFLYYKNNLYFIYNSIKNSQGFLTPKSFINKYAQNFLDQLVLLIYTIFNIDKSIHRLDKLIDEKLILFEDEKLLDLVFISLIHKYFIEFESTRGVYDELLRWAVLKRIHSNDFIDLILEIFENGIVEIIEEKKPLSKYKNEIQNMIIGLVNIYPKELRPYLMDILEKFQNKYNILLISKTTTYIDNNGNDAPEEIKNIIDDYLSKSQISLANNNDLSYVIKAKSNNNENITVTIDLFSVLDNENKNTRKTAIEDLKKKFGSEFDRFNNLIQKKEKEIIDSYSKDAIQELKNYFNKYVNPIWELKNFLQSDSVNLFKSNFGAISLDIWYEAFYPYFNNNFESMKEVLLFDIAALPYESSEKAIDRLIERIQEKEKVQKYITKAKGLIEDKYNSTNSKPFLYKTSLVKLLFKLLLQDKNQTLIKFKDFLEIFNNLLSDHTNYDEESYIIYHNYEYTLLKLLTISFFQKYNNMDSDIPLKKQDIYKLAYLAKNYIINNTNFKQIRNSDIKKLNQTFILAILELENTKEYLEEDYTDLSPTLNYEKYNYNYCSILQLIIDIYKSNLDISISQNILDQAFEQLDMYIDLEKYNCFKASENIITKAKSNNNKIIYNKSNKDLFYKLLTTAYKGIEYNIPSTKKLILYKYEKFKNNNLIEHYLEKQNFYASIYKLCSLTPLLKTNQIDIIYDHILIFMENKFKIKDLNKTTSEDLYLTRLCGLIFKQLIPEKKNTLFNLINDNLYLISKDNFSHFFNFYSMAIPFINNKQLVQNFFNELLHPFKTHNYDFQIGMLHIALINNLFYYVENEQKIQIEYLLNQNKHNITNHPDYEKDFDSKKYIRQMYKNIDNIMKVIKENESRKND